MLAYLQAARNHHGTATAAAALASVGARAHLAYLVKLVKDDKQRPWVRSGAVAALGRIGDPEAVPSLVRITGHLNWRALCDFLNELCSLV